MPLHVMKNRHENRSIYVWNRKDGYTGGNSKYLGNGKICKRMFARKYAENNKDVQKWLSATNLGKPLLNAFIIPSKTPIEGYIASKMDPARKYSKCDMLDNAEKNGWKVGMVINICNTKKYYKVPVQDEDVVYHSISLTGNDVIPERIKLDMIFDLIDKHTKNEEKPYVIIHCTHGQSRTGFVMMLYYIERSEVCLRLTFDELLEEWKEARSHEFSTEKRKLLSFLKDAHEKRKQELLRQNGVNANDLENNILRLKHMQHEVMLNERDEKDIYDALSDTEKIFDKAFKDNENGNNTQVYKTQASLLYNGWIYNNMKALDRLANSYSKMNLYQTKLLNLGE